MPVLLRVFGLQLELSRRAASTPAKAAIPLSDVCCSVCPSLVFHGLTLAGEFSFALSEG